MKSSSSLCAFAALMLLACGSSSPHETTADGGGGADASKPVDAGPGADAPLHADAGACAGPCPQSNVRHLVVIVQENHTFDNHFGHYCTAPAGSNPTCNDGPACCEAIPTTDAGIAPVTITDSEMGSRDPDHTQACELAEMDGNKMDDYATASCGSPRNIAVADPTIIQPYWTIAGQGALADRYFQPIVGQSESNDMYLARARYVFTDNSVSPQGAVGVTCDIESTFGTFTDMTIGDLMTGASVPWAWFADGYSAMVKAAGACPTTPADCPLQVPFYPCAFDPSDVPFEYYATTRDNAKTMKDLSAFESALGQGGLPAVSYIKAFGYRSEHPGYGNKLSVGVQWASALIQQIEQSAYAVDTLVLLTYDEGGGYYDHVPPPGNGAVDQKPYGTRIPLLAVGPFARKNFVSHVTMEHSSIVKFIEWNWLGGKTGQLAGRDTSVANIGSLLDPAATGTAVPEN